MSERIPPMTVKKINTTEEAIDFLTFFNTIIVERCLRGFKWWILHSLQEYADVDERAATQVSLDKATRLGSTTP